MAKSKELRKLSAEDLDSKLEETLKSLQQLRFGTANDPEKTGMAIRNTRRDVARIKQAIGEKQRETAAAGQAG